MKLPLILTCLLAGVLCACSKSSTPHYYAIALPDAQANTIAPSQRPLVVVADVELARLTPGGKLARYPTRRSLVTQLVADGEGAWLAAYTGAYEFTVEHYTAAGRQWSRVLRGLRDVRLEIQPGGDLRLLALESDGISVRRIAAGTGQVLWRTGRPQMERECAALNGGNR